MGGQGTEHKRVKEGNLYSSLIFLIAVNGEGMGCVRIMSILTGQGQALHHSSPPPRALFIRRVSEAGDS